MYCSIQPRHIEVIQFLLLNHYDFIFVQESYLSPDSTFHVSEYKTLRKDCSVTRRGIINPMENLEAGVLILVRNGPTYSPLSTQHLSLLKPCSNYLAVTIKIKASSIHLFNLYAPPICSSSDICPKSFSFFLLPSSPATFIFDNFNCHHSHSSKDQLGKD